MLAGLWAVGRPHSRSHQVIRNGPRRSERAGQPRPHHRSGVRVPRSPTPTFQADTSTRGTRPTLRARRGSASRPTSLAAGANVKYIESRRLWRQRSRPNVGLSTRTTRSICAPRRFTNSVASTVHHRGPRTVRRQYASPSSCARTRRTRSLEASCGAGRANCTWRGQKNTVITGKSGYYLSTGVSGSVGVGSYLQVWNRPR